jgi:hypothetical protein
MVAAMSEIAAHDDLNRSAVGHRLFCCGVSANPALQINGNEQAGGA